MSPFLNRTLHWFSKQYMLASYIIYVFYLMIVKLLIVRRSKAPSLQVAVWLCITAIHMAGGQVAITPETEPALSLSSQPWTHLTASESAAWFQHTWVFPAANITQPLVNMPSHPWRSLYTTLLCPCRCIHIEWPRSMGFSWLLPLHLPCVLQGPACSLHFNMPCLGSYRTLNKNATHTFPLPFSMFLEVLVHPQRGTL